MRAGASKSGQNMVYYPHGSAFIHGESTAVGLAASMGHSNMILHRLAHDSQDSGPSFASLWV